MLSVQQINQRAADIAAKLHPEDVKRLIYTLTLHRNEHERTRVRRLPEYVVRVSRGQSVKLGPVSASEIVDMIARGE